MNTLHDEVWVQPFEWLDGWVITLMSRYSRFPTPFPSILSEDSLRSIEVRSS